MTTEEKLAAIVIGLKTSGVDTLVMGGHAVRYYGVSRNTVDFDLFSAVAAAEQLRERLSTVDLVRGYVEEQVWRSGDFMRLSIGRLPDGRDEYLEFWMRNHLLGDFSIMRGRAEIGLYGGQRLAFLSLPDLIRSKETERESDWQDISLLEEIQDDRHGAAASRSKDLLVRLLSNLRSRSAMQRMRSSERLTPEVAQEALILCSHPVTHAFLRPLSPDTAPSSVAAAIDRELVSPLRSVEFASPKHFALIEIARRAYKARAMNLDRADKQAKLAFNR